MKLFKKKKRINAVVEFNLEEFNELVRDAHSTLDRLDNKVKETRKLRSDLHRLSHQLDKNIKRINEFKLKSKIKYVEDKDDAKNER